MRDEGLDLNELQSRCHIGGMQSIRRWEFLGLLAEVRRLRDRLKVARPVVRAADRYCRCLAEFDDPKYCIEWLDDLDKTILDYAVDEGEQA
jgi:hypothetical protein